MSSTGGPRRGDGVTEFLTLRWADDETVRCTIRPELLNPAGLLSGVVAHALIDYGMGAALWPHLTAEESLATVSLSLNYIATARDGDVVCASVLDRRTRTNASLRSEVRHHTGRLLTTAVGVYAIFPRR